MGLAKIQKRTWARPRRGRWNPSEACLLITATHAHRQDTTPTEQRFRSSGSRNVLEFHRTTSACHPLIGHVILFSFAACLISAPRASLSAAFNAENGAHVTSVNEFERILRELPIRSYLILLSNAFHSTTTTTTIYFCTEKIKFHLYCFQLFLEFHG